MEKQGKSALFHGYFRYIVLILILIVLFAQYRISAQVSELAAALDVQEDLITELQISKLSSMDLNEKLKTYIPMNEDSSSSDIEYLDLTDLTTFEYSLYQKLLTEHSNDIWKQIEPITLLKIRLCATYNKEYELLYEMQRKKDAIYGVGYDSFVTSIENVFREDFEIFRDVYDISINEYTSNGVKRLSITWTYKDAPVDSRTGQLYYSFRFIEEDGIWKVDNLAMQ